MPRVPEPEGTTLMALPMGGSDIWIDSGGWVAVTVEQSRMHVRDHSAGQRRIPGFVPMASLLTVLSATA